MSESSSQSMTEQAYGRVLELILTGRLRPGDWLDRKEIAESLGVSLMPVSDAIQRLSVEGFVVTAPRRGTQVRVPDRGEVRGQWMVREALECQAARMYAGAPLRAALDQLLPLARSADDHGPSDPASCQADIRFHAALVDVADCRALSQCFERVANLTMFHHMAYMPSLFAAGGESNLELLGRLAESDASSADEALRWHLRAGKERLM